MSHKKIFAFLQLYNEYEKGNLIRCLDNCQQWADEIFIYDDCSTDGSVDIYLKYTDKNNIIIGEKNEFNRELFHKHQLLELTLAKQPDFIGWIDGDDILDKTLTESMQLFLNNLPSNIDGVSLHNINLWRDDRYYRIDNMFNGLHKINIWRNNGQLSYSPNSGLHQPQHPSGMNNICSFGNKLLHYGFSTKEAIIRKYLDYKAQGQSGWDLYRLIDEESSFSLEPVPIDWYPTKNIPTTTGDQPTPIDYDDVRQYNSWTEYLNAK